MSKEYPWGKGTLKWTYDAAANDSDKSWTVPSGKIWAVRYLYADLVATGDVGSRYLGVSVTDGTTVLYLATRPAAAAASQRTAIAVGSDFNSYSTSIPTTDLAANALTTKETRYMPELLLAAGSVIRMWDTAAISAAGDDMVNVLHYVEYDA